MIFCIFIIMNKSHEKTKTNNALILLSLCIQSLICAIRLCHRAPLLAIKNTSVSLAVALGDMLLYYNEHTHWNRGKRDS